MAFPPFNNAWAQYVAAFGAKNPKVVGKLDKIERILPAAGTVHELRGCNSYGLVSAVDFKGRVEMAFNRIDLATFHGTAAKQDNTIRTRKHPLSTYEALSLIDRKFGWGIPATSIEDLPITWGIDSVGVVTIRAKPADQIVFGETIVKLVPGADSIADLKLNGDIGYGLYPSGQIDKGQAHYLSFPLDTTEKNAYLASMWTGQPIDQELISAISELTGKDWSLSAGEYSLAGAEVTYAGPVRPAYDFPKPNYSRIATVLLGSACTNFAGELVLYHNPN